MEDNKNIGVAGISSSTPSEKSMSDNKVSSS